MICADRRQCHELAAPVRSLLLQPAEAAGIIDECEAVVRERWYAIARREGVSEADCNKIARAFAYQGFRLQP